MCCHTRLMSNLTEFKYQCHPHSFLSLHESVNNNNDYYIALLGIWIPEGREQHHYPMCIILSGFFSGKVPERRYSISKRVHLMQ